MDAARMKEIEALALADGWIAGVWLEPHKVYAAAEFPQYSTAELQLYNDKFAEGRAKGRARHKELTRSGLEFDERDKDQER